MSNAYDEYNFSKVLHDHDLADYQIFIFQFIENIERKNWKNVESLLFRFWKKPALDAPLSKHIFHSGMQDWVNEFVKECDDHETKLVLLDIFDSLLMCYGES